MHTTRRKLAYPVFYQVRKSIEGYFGSSFGTLNFIFPFGSVFSLKGDFEFDRQNRAFYYRGILFGGSFIWRFFQVQEFSIFAASWLYVTLPVSCLESWPPPLNSLRRPFGKLAPALSSSSWRHPTSRRVTNSQPLSITPFNRAPGSKGNFAWKDIRPVSLLSIATPPHHNASPPPNNRPV